jgi:predicted acetyltransferase
VSSNNGKMPVLTEPSAHLHESFLAALREYRAEGLYPKLDPAQLADPARFGDYLAGLRANANPRPHQDDTLVPQTTLWLVEGHTYLGRLSIRHALTDLLRIKGGNIGYEIRPTARCRGYATLMLGLSLPIANKLGVDPALLTCDATNVASRRVIEANGGQLIDSSGEILRFSLSTS